MNRDGIMIGLLTALLFGLVWLIATDSDNDSRAEIKEKLESKHAEVVSIEQNSIFRDDPFKFSEKNTKYPQIYKFTYEEDGELKDGWVSFDYFSEHWKFDFKE
jgi:hypothetical protein